MTTTTLAPIRNTHPVLPVRIARRLINAYQDQVAKETHEFLNAQFAQLDRLTGAAHRPRRADRTDPLEQLMRLPARQPRPQPR